MSRYKDELGKAVYGDNYTKRHALEPMCVDATRIIKSLRTKLALLKEANDDLSESAKHCPSCGLLLPHHEETCGNEVVLLNKRIEELEAAYGGLAEYDRLNALVKQQDRRIEELEEMVRDWVGAEHAPAGCVVLTTEQINEAWDCIRVNPSVIIRSAGRAIFRIFGIVPCPGCWSCMEKDDPVARRRKDCHGKGWVIEGGEG